MSASFRRIPYGVMNWAELVRECHFVDNTRFLRALETCKTPVFLRPKRFGKSLVCSMLEHDYDIALKDRFDELFGMTEIGRNPTPLRNACLILRFDFSTVQVGTLYYLGLLTFADETTLTVPNLTVKNMFVDYYDESDNCGNLER